SWPGDVLYQQRILLRRVRRDLIQQLGKGRGFPGSFQHFMVGTNSYNLATGAIQACSTGGTHRLINQGTA
ncbi:MAG: hypothetical protein ACI9R3_006584, partial [Verrucomicrobiales bacterium]